MNNMENEKERKIPKIHFICGKDWKHCDRYRYLISVAWGRILNAEEGTVPYRHWFEINIRIPEINFYWR